MDFCSKLTMFPTEGNFVVMTGKSVVKGVVGVVLSGTICSSLDKLCDAVSVRIFRSMVVASVIFCLARK